MATISWLDSANWSAGAVPVAIDDVAFDLDGKIKPIAELSIMPAKITEADHGDN